MKSSMPFAAVVTRALVTLVLLSSLAVPLASGQVSSSGRPTYAANGTSHSADYHGQTKTEPRHPATAQGVSKSAEAGNLQRGVTLKNYAALPLDFEQNVGQVDSSARFISNLGGYSAYL